MAKNTTEINFIIVIEPRDGDSLFRWDVKLYTADGRTPHKSDIAMTDWGALRWGRKTARRLAKDWKRPGSSHTVRYYTVRLHG